MHVEEPIAIDVASTARPRPQRQSPTPAPSDSAALLFQQATQHRRTGELKRAIDSYESLQRRFPDSPEAQLSHISISDLLVKVGQERRALKKLATYMRRFPEGDLFEDALYRRARLLESVGRRDEARTAWQQIRARFAGSVYDAEARRRIEKLSEQEDSTP
jgi:TolA-binding protein